MAALAIHSGGADTGEMLDERLGRHSVVVASLGLIPGLLVIAMLADGIANPGVSYRRVVVWAFFVVSPVAAFCPWIAERLQPAPRSRARRCRAGDVRRLVCAPHPSSSRPVLGYA